MGDVLRKERLRAEKKRLRNPVPGRGLPLKGSIHKLSVTVNEVNWIKQSESECIYVENSILLRLLPEGTDLSPVEAINPS